MRVLHMIFGSLLAGGTLIFIGAVLPGVRRNAINEETFSWVVDRFFQLTNIAILIQLLTGADLVANLYGINLLLETTRGHLILGMSTCWLLLAVVLHKGIGNLRTEMDQNAPQEAVESTQVWFAAAGILSVVVLGVAGWL